MLHCSSSGSRGGRSTVGIWRRRSEGQVDTPGRWRRECPPTRTTHVPRVRARSGRGSAAIARTQPKGLRRDLRARHHLGTAATAVERPGPSPESPSRLRHATSTRRWPGSSRLHGSDAPRRRPTPATFPTTHPTRAIDRCRDGRAVARCRRSDGLLCWLTDRRRALMRAVCCAYIGAGRTARCNSARDRRAASCVQTSRCPGRRAG